ncbi:acetyltransferase-like isoleucine patch superfamily enzyme [Paucibacter oligotrophus]|uniref:Acetyltransferase-like isoleucine patch superfamily enzyme n=1 Tax=Roseateles oligotrophus TaxID=1769250 RepID=A0A840LFI5_9BURK|nr:acyltransferase [Roseateles oligotrophus]MBB4844067.1 acetyltransferase-like isoleucine patch superfamily enzyme [Roseateles oligotrophus]
MQRRYERLLGLISRSNPLDLDAWTRMLLVQYFFHVSERQRLEIVEVAGARRLLNLLTPTHFKGQGRIRVAATAVFGVPRSPGSYGASYVEARTPDSLIEVGPGTVFNNRCVLISEGASIRFGADCLIGPELHVMDSNSHDLVLERRRQPDPRPAAVEIGNQVFIGSRVTLLKGVKLGAGCVVGAGAVLRPGFEAPPNSVVMGNPAVVLGQTPNS